MESRLAALGVGGGEQVEGSSIKEKELMDMDNSVVIAGVWGVERGIYGDGKNIIKIFKKRIIFSTSCGTSDPYELCVIEKYF